MIPLEDRVPQMSDDELRVLHANATRLVESGPARQKMAAEKLLPILDVELAERRARAPAPRVKAAVKKAAAPKKAAAKKKAPARKTRAARASGSDATDDGAPKDLTEE